MKKKILGIFVCMLLSATTVHATESQKDNLINLILPSSSIQQCLLQNWTEMQKLTSLNGNARDHFGTSISISGDYAIIGANPDSSAYIFKRSGSRWIQEAKLTASGALYFGDSVSISGDYAIVGATGYDSGRGSAYVFKRSGTSWIQEVQLLAPDGAAGDSFGCSVSINGDYAIIGAYQHGSARGSVYVFIHYGTTWVEDAELTASDGGAWDFFGISVSMSDDYIVIGADYVSNSGAGSAYIFKRSGSNWIEEAKLTAPDGAVDDAFGCSVSISGDYAVIGACGDDDNGEYSGSAHVFIHINNTWIHQVKLLASDGGTEDRFGLFISICDDIVFIGAPDDGSAYVFNRSGTTWTQQQKLHSSDHASRFGWPVYIDGDTAFIGSAGSGSVYVFKKDGINQPPNTPTITGLLTVKVGKTYNYVFNSIDPEGNDVYYFIDWGDSSSGWVGPLTSGVNTTLNHTWNQTNLYTIMAKAKDSYDHESNWSTFTVSVLQWVVLIGRMHNITTSGDYITFVPIHIRALWLSPFSVNKYSYGLMMISTNTLGFVGKSFIIGLFDAAVLTNRSTSISDHLKRLFPLPQGL